MFTEVPQPLAYAETLLGTFASLSRMADDARLLEEFAFAVGQLTGSELAQVYLLDAGHSQLGLSAECFEG
ncbi:hypothetical protein QNM99_23860 [Pseudomonas sp. PCH446]